MKDELKKVKAQLDVISKKYGCDAMEELEKLGHDASEGEDEGESEMQSGNDKQVKSPMYSEEGKNQIPKKMIVAMLKKKA
jgi:hypothetical protein